MRADFEIAEEGKKRRRLLYRGEERRDGMHATGALVAQGHRLAYIWKNAYLWVAKR
jgi:hypothetical protein